TSVVDERNRPRARLHAIFGIRDKEHCGFRTAGIVANHVRRDVHGVGDLLATDAAGVVRNHAALFRRYTPCLAAAFAFFSGGWSLFARQLRALAGSLCTLRVGSGLLLFAAGRTLRLRRRLLCGRLLPSLAP